MVDKRKVRRDHADFFSTTAEGIRGKRAVDWRLVDAVAPRSRFGQVVADRAKVLAAKSDRPKDGRGLTLDALAPTVSPTGYAYRFVTVALDAGARRADLTMKGPTDAPAGLRRRAHR